MRMYLHKEVSKRDFLKFLFLLSHQKQEKNPVIGSFYLDLCVSLRRQK